MREETRLPYNRLSAVFDRFSWGGIFAGVALGLMVQFALTMLGVGIGAATVNPGTEQDPMAGLGIGSALWLLGTLIISMFIAGWTASRASGALWRPNGALHGAVTWAVSTMAAVFILTSAAGALVSGASSLLGGVLSTTTQAAASSEELTEEMREILRQRGIDIDSIRQQTQDPQTQQQVRQTGERVAGGISKAGIFGFIGLLTGWAAACLGGWLGTSREDRLAAPPYERAA
jgi:hypothetical protein